MNVKDLKKLIERLPDDTPIILMNEIGIGQSKYTNVEIIDVFKDLDSEDSFTEEFLHDVELKTVKIKGVVIYN